MADTVVPLLPQTVVPCLQVAVLSHAFLFVLRLNEGGPGQALVTQHPPTPAKWRRW